MEWASSETDGLCLVGGAARAGIKDLWSVAGTAEGRPPLVPSSLPFPNFVHHSVVQDESFMYNLRNLWSRFYQSLVQYFIFNYAIAGCICNHSFKPIIFPPSSDANIEYSLYVVCMILRWIVLPLWDRHMVPCFIHIGSLALFYNSTMQSFFNIDTAL
jgi:hypothetical protein